MRIAVKSAVSCAAERFDESWAGLALRNCEDASRKLSSPFAARALPAEG